MGNSPRQLSVRRKILVVLGSALGLGCGFGPMFYSVVGIFLKPIAASFSWSRAEISILPMLGIIGTSIGAPLLGYIADRKGWNKVNAFCVALFPLGLLAISVAPASLTYIIAVAVLTGVVGAATSAPGYVPVVSMVFDRRLGLALGLTMVGSGVSSGAMPIVAGKLLEVMDWRQAYACLAGASMLLGVAAHQIIFRSLGTGQSRSDLTKNLAATSSPAAVLHEEGYSLGMAIKSYRLWLIGVFGALVTGSTLGAIVHLAAYASDRGISAGLVAQSMGLIGVGLTIARIAAGFLLDKVFAPLVALGAALIGAAGFFMLTGNLLESTWMLPVAATLFGISAGAEGDIIPFLARKYFGIASIGSIFGVLFTFITLGGALGTYLYGLSFDLNKSYIPMLQISGTLCSIFGLAILALGPYPFASGKNAS